MPSVPPTSILFQADHGTGNMGLLSDDASKARFGLPERFVLVFVRVHFTDLTGSASATLNDLTVNVDSRLFSHYDAALFIVRSLGKNNDAFLRIDPDEYDKWVFEAGDVVVLTWTNPDPGNLSWGVEVGLVPAATVVQ